MTNSGNSILAGLDRLVEKYHLLKHPFYRAWTQGTLSRESLALYAEQYYQHVLAFPENLKRLASRANGRLAHFGRTKISRRNSIPRARIRYSGGNSRTLSARTMRTRCHAAAAGSGGAARRV